MTQQPDYKTLADGSIDYAYYFARTRQIRAQSYHEALKSLFRMLTGFLRPRPPVKATPPANVTQRAGRTYRAKSATASRQARRQTQA
ncbi:hypothetical protein LZG00_17100 [Rhodobacteraceae bacterium LMO-12]|nr:hypothetical protein [Rhodobacteraceae bacterium LMO-JJ12]